MRVLKKKANVQHTCIDSDAYVLMNDGRRKKLKYLEIGDKVKSLDEKGRLIDTNIIMIMDISNQTGIILCIIIESSFFEK